MKNKCILLLLTFALLLSGCINPHTQYSQEGITLSSSGAERVANDIVYKGVNNYSRKDTYFYINRVNGYDAFIYHGVLGKAIEAELKKAGFTVVLDEKNKPNNTITIAYTIDQLDKKNSFYVDVHIGEFRRMGFFYTVDSAGSWINQGITVRNDEPTFVDNPLIENDAQKDRSQYDLKGLVYNTPLPAVTTKEIVVAKPVIEKTPVKYTEDRTGWAVQVMLLTRNAPKVLERHKRRIEAMGYRVYIVEEGNAKKLRVGPFESSTIVRLVLNEMRVNGYPDAFVWKKNN